MTNYSPKYKRKKHPFIIRLIAIYRILFCRNFILIDCNELKVDDQKARRVRLLFRTDYDLESDQLTLKAAYLKSTDKS